MDNSSAPNEKNTDYLLIIMPILSIISLFVFVLSDKWNIKFPTLDTSKFEVSNVITPEKKVIKRPETESGMETIKSQEIFDKYIQSISRYPGEYGIYIENMSNGLTLRHNDKTEFYGASLYKIPIAAATIKQIEKGRLNKDDTITYLPYDYAAGTGVINQYKFGIELKVEDVLTELIKNSDNSAQNMLLRTLMYQNVEESFNFGVPESQSSKFYKYNLTTPYEIAMSIENFYYGTYLSEDGRDYFINLMYPTSFDDRITPHLSNGLIFKHKIGSWPDSWHDCGIVFGKKQELVVCLMSQKATYENFQEVSKLTGELINMLVE